MRRSHPKKTDEYRQISESDDPLSEETARFFSSDLGSLLSADPPTEETSDPETVWSHDADSSPTEVRRRPDLPTLDPEMVEAWSAPEVDEPETFSADVFLGEETGDLELGLDELEPLDDIHVGPTTPPQAIVAPLDPIERPPLPRRQPRAPRPVVPDSPAVPEPPTQSRPRRRRSLLTIVVLTCAGLAVLASIALCVGAFALL